MNDRLAKLIEQCYEYNEMMQGTWFNKTKFAELIVEECISIAVAGNAEAVVAVIKERFGVEE